MATTSVGTKPAIAQLSSDDIAALQRQGETEGWTFTVGENPATAYSLDELCGLVVPEDWWVDARVDPCTPRRDLPETFDWRNYDGRNCCTPVKNQGGCGSCWAFATVGPLECSILIKDNTTEDLSEQWLVSCTPAGSCSGGWWAHAYHAWSTDSCGDTGAVLESDFPYVASDAPCGCPYPHPYLIDGWAYIGSAGSVPPTDSIKQAILDHGPVTAGVCANSAMQGYNGGIFDGCENGDLNHGVVLVGWDDNQGPEGVWFMRNSWGSGWGEDNGYGNGGYMRIPYGCSRIGYAACYIEYLPKFVFEYPTGRPEAASANHETVFQVRVVPGWLTPIPGTGQLHYRINGGSWVQEAMTELWANRYEAVLPAEECSSVFDWYVSVEAYEGGTFTDPGDAPTSTYVTTVGEAIAVMEHDFETDEGWTVGDVDDDATTGIWDRDDPEGTNAQPENDHTPSPGTDCFVTDHRAGSSIGSYDVDGGKTTLFSPTIDLSGVTDVIISYYRWYSNDEGSNPNADVFVVDISNDNGGSWTNVEEVGPAGEGTSGGWIYHAFDVADFVTPTDQIKLRFIASDEGDGSIVEAAIDSFNVATVQCDILPPDPDPVTWEVPPMPVSTSEVTMTATEVVDADSQPCEYCFNCTAGSGHYRTWGSRVYNDTGLSANAVVTYQCQARDSADPNPNEGGWSWPTESTATHIETPTDVDAIAIGDDYIEVEATGSFTNLYEGNSGIVFRWWLAISNPDVDPPLGESEVPRGMTTTASSLSPGTEYTFRAWGRNQYGIETPDYAEHNYTTTGGAVCGTIFGDIDGDWDIDGDDIGGFVRAKLGQDPMGDENQACANYGGTLEEDIASFVADLLG